MSIKLTKDQRTALSKIVSALEQAKAGADDLWQELEGIFSEKSDKWRKSDKGQEYQDDLTALEEWAGEIETAVYNVPSFE